MNMFSISAVYYGMLVSAAVNLQNAANANLPVALDLPTNLLAS